MKNPASLDRRAAGVLLHPTSLPGGHGVGDLGSEAYRFCEFLVSARQTWWQMFPLGPPGMGNSPYQVLSAFAGNPLLISLDDLRREGLLKSGDMPPLMGGTRVNYVTAWRHKLPCLELAAERFFSRRHPLRREFDRFQEEEREWLTNHALFSAIKHVHKGNAWNRWDPELRDRNPAALRQARKELASLVRFHSFIQFIFFRQWRRLRNFCAQRGLKLLGDMPIFVALDSSDVWANPHLFWLDKYGQPLYVAGTPPDYFSRSGQRWGNPLYRWDVLRREGYDWWLKRFRSTFEMFDGARLDHFIGFQRYWRIPAKDETAEHGKWVPGPQDHFFRTVFKKMGRLPLIAEDLGLITQEVKDLRDRFDLPGMRVLQFAFGADPEANNYLPHSYPRRSVVYTGTHDNDTTVGWFHDMGSSSSTRTLKEIRNERTFALRYMNSDGKEIHWDMIRLAFMSTSALAIIPAQDLLGLGSEARMNLPGTGSGNWEWRLRAGSLTPRIRERLVTLTRDYGRGK